MRFGVERHIHHARQKESFHTFDVVLLHVSVAELEMDCPAAVLVAVVDEVLAGLYVVLVTVSPVEMDFLAVVGDGVFVALGVAAQRHKVALVVIAAEEGVEMVENVSLKFRAGLGLARALPQFEILPPALAAVILRSEIAIGVQSFLTEVLLNLYGDFR